MIKQLPSHINWDTFQARGLGSGLTTNSSCHLFGWGTAAANFRRVETRIYNSTFCEATLPQVYCSTVPAMDDERCSAFLGSPIMCNQQTEFSGFFILNTFNQNRQCTGTGTDQNRRFLLPLHSVREFTEWIDQVSAGESLKISMGLFFVLLISIFKF